VESILFTLITKNTLKPVTLNNMKIEIESKKMQFLLGLFLGFGAMSYGAMFVTYVLWFLGMID